MTEQTWPPSPKPTRSCFVIDARAGVTAGDEIIAQALAPRGQARDPGRQQMRRPHRALRAGRVYALGFGEAVALSAEHALGMENWQTR